MPYLHRDGVALYYEWDDGGAPPVVLLHGWCCDHSFLAPQRAHLARAGHAILSLDLRGHGRSDAPQQPYPISAFSDDVIWICAELGLKRPVLLGHSMGGIVAYDIAARRPDLPGAIVMIDSAVARPAAAQKMIGPIAERLRGPDYRDELRELMTSAFFLATDDADRREQILKAMTAAPQHVMVSAYLGLGDFDPTIAHVPVSTPSLYIAANEPSPRSDIARLKELVPALMVGQTVGSGHFCQLEVPGQVNAMIDRFLALTG
ncbi:pimeloyl-ACP methyl ester carboxylesterase [Rhizobium subbaraonis]|uniref:Pimeloyl-ACP methyl ester carboxylesterase n=1 Tax=Rhizobium subbaraonis TaxID=908946 RepID=A0A285U7S2_9HYPH|nr:alpha/beta hydrolase [Rhizobium subbaraonis]SOC37763.1 pimeloyl-ACP methyl ester carboxylesterase [Rhizobium subbaraonis]